MHIKDIDLNLLRLFDAVYRLRSVSRAAEALDLTQPAASQGLTRLRALLADPLFVRAAGGVQPTPQATRLAEPVRQALAMLEQALGESAGFEPLRSRRRFRIHMSDIGESRFLPELMALLREQAPGVQVETLPLPRAAINDALDSGQIDFAFGFLPMVKDSQRVQLLKDRYIVMLRAGHPFVRQHGHKRGAALIDALQQLEFVCVRTHADTLRTLQQLKLEDRVRLTTEHFMVLPSIVQATDLAVVMPRSIALGFAGGYAIVEPAFALRDFAVSLHWSRRFQADPGNQWLRAQIVQAFRA
jgi:DNA-binding transcriptional LysR family regulator